MKSLIISFALVCGGTAALAVEHPCMLWTKSEAAAIRQRIETDAAAKKQYERMLEMEKGGKQGGNPPWLNLFKYAVLGDKAAGEAEKQQLLRFIGTRPPVAVAGNPESSNAPWREDRTLDALRYDVLYEELTPEQRKGIEDTIRGYVKWHRDNPGPWKYNARTGWLPNMQWPTAAGTHVLAAALGDEAVVKDIFESSGGWQWFFDNYLVDGRFYMEEFGKYYSNIGAMMLWGEGLQRLGLGKYGFGYTGKGGATMRHFLNMLIYAGYPRLKRDAGGTHDFLAFTMGDAGNANILIGYNADGTGGHTTWWGGGRMNGAIRKAMQPLWWEMGHRRWPADGYDYFLAQLRKPGEGVYLPSLYFGLGPIDAKKVTPPAARSFVAPERGFAMLRAEESPAYWESPKPAVGLQFGMYYVHYVHDCFAILQFVAHNRLLYNRLGAVGSGYAGGDPWRDHVRGLGSGVVVDGRRAQPVDGGEAGTKNHRIRQHFAPSVKFVAIRAKGIYPGIEQERALVLTDEYLLDVFQLTGTQPRVFDWHVLTPANVSDGAWEPAASDNTKPHLTDVRTRNAGDQTWSVTLPQPDGIGVRVWMLGEAGTTLFAGHPPGVPTNAPATQLIAARQKPATTFVALHEPFENNKPQLREFARLAQTDHAVAARVTSEEFSDRVLVATTEQPVTLAGDSESFTFAGFAHIRVTDRLVTVTGNINALKLKVTGTPKLLLNSRETDATVASGFLELK